MQKHRVVLHAGACEGGTYGVHCMGGTWSRYDYQLEAASAEDEQTWFENEKWRRP